MKSATAIDLSGVTGYDDLGMTRGGKQLYGDGLILQTIPGLDGKTYWVMDSNGKKHYVKGSIING
jgi:hypothetical protein